MIEKASTSELLSFVARKSTSNMEAHLQQAAREELVRRGVSE